VLAAALVVVSLLPAPQGDPLEQAQRIAEREGLQTSLSFDPAESAARPSQGNTPTPPPRARWSPSEDRGTRRTPRDRTPSSDSDGGGAAWAKGLLWLLGGALVVALVVGVVAALRGTPSGKTTSGTTEPLPAAGAELPRAALGPAEALAAEGHFAEAVHRLLIDALAILAAQAGHSFPKAMTSREILASLRLAPEAREALRELVDAVELSHFGGRPVGEPAWRRAHEAFTGLGRASRDQARAGVA